MSRRVQRRSRWRDFRGVLRPTGAVLGGVAVGQLLCALIGGAVEWLTVPAARRQTDDIVWLLLAAAITGLSAAAFYLYGRRHATENLTRREAVLAVALIWLGAGVFGGLPFVLATA